MTQDAGRANLVPGPSAAKPVTEPPGGEVEQALNESPQDPGVEKGSRLPANGDEDGDEDRGGD
jgi:hypothetical protein